MAQHDERRAELIAGHLADDLSTAERREFAELRAADPSVDAELAELGALTAGLTDAAGPAPSAALRDRVLADAAATDAAPASAARPAPRRAVALVAAAAACLAIGAVGALGLQSALTAPPAGGPGTLGAVEHVDFAGEPSGGSVDGDLIAHTWGTETSLRLDGLDAGETYEVVLVATDGREFEAGTLLGTDGVVTCRMNAAVLREDVAGVVIRAAAGTEFGAAEVPAVG